MNRRLLVVAILLVSVSTGCSSPGDVSCAAGLTECSGACVDTLADAANCGGCGSACGAGSVCAAGTCKVSCAAGLTECSGACVDTLADAANCGGCGGVCGAGSACAAGTCKIVLLGAGTAGDPYRASPVPVTCLGYLNLATTPPATANGVYITHPAAADIGVYCDMTHGGWTYEGFGTGQYTATYGGWTPVGRADFLSSVQFDEAFAYLFNRSGLVNLQPGFTSTYCGIIDRATGGCYGLAGNVIMSLSQAGVRYCNPGGGYTLPSYVLSVGPNSSTWTERTSFTAAEAGNVGTSACNPNGNPGIFVRRYQ